MDTRCGGWSCLFSSWIFDSVGSWSRNLEHLSRPRSCRWRRCWDSCRWIWGKPWVKRRGGWSLCLPGRPRGRCWPGECGETLSWRDSVRAVGERTGKRLHSRRGGEGGCKEGWGAVQGAGEPRPPVAALDRAWRGISAKGWGPDDLQVSSQDLAWPWMRRWMNDRPPAPGDSFEGKVLA